MESASNAARMQSECSRNGCRIRLERAAFVWHSKCILNIKQRSLYMQNWFIEQSIQCRFHVSTSLQQYQYHFRRTSRLVCIKLWVIASLGSVQVVRFFDFAMHTPPFTRRTNRSAVGGLVVVEAIMAVSDKKHLKNVGPIRHCEPPHAACFTLPFTRCRYCRTPPAHRCPQQHQRQCVTEGTAMAPWNGPNYNTTGFYRATLC